MIERLKAAYPGVRSALWEKLRPWESRLTVEVEPNTYFCLSLDGRHAVGGMRVDDVYHLLP